MIAACLCNGSGGEIFIARMRGEEVFERNDDHLRVEEVGGGVFVWACGSFR